MLQRALTGIAIFIEKFFTCVSCMMRHFQHLTLNFDENWLFFLSFKKITSLKKEIFSERQLSLVLG